MNFKHGFNGTPEYQAYRDAKSRCQNIRHKCYEDYGGRGIEFRFHSFPDFYKELGKRPTSYHSIDRINNNGHYEVGNVRWATKREQIHNTRSSAPLGFCKAGHSLANPESYHITSQGYPECRICRKEYHKRRGQEEKA